MINGYSSLWPPVWSLQGNAVWGARERHFNSLICAQHSLWLHIHTVAPPHPLARVCSSRACPEAFWLTQMKQDFLQAWDRCWAGLPAHRETHSPAPPRRVGSSVSKFGFLWPGAVTCSDSAAEQIVQAARGGSDTPNLESTSNRLHLFFSSSSEQPAPGRIPAASSHPTVE